MIAEEHITIVLDVGEHLIKMRIIIDLDQSILDKVQKKAGKEDRSRKKMLELIIERSVEK